MSRTPTTLVSMSGRRWLLRTGSLLVMVGSSDGAAWATKKPEAAAGSGRVLSVGLLAHSLHPGRRPGKGEIRKETVVHVRRNVPGRQRLGNRDPSALPLLRTSSTPGKPSRISPSHSPRFQNHGRRRSGRRRDPLGVDGLAQRVIPPLRVDHRQPLAGRSMHDLTDDQVMVPGGHDTVDAALE